MGGNDVTEESSADEIAFKIITLGTPLVNRCKVGRVVVCALTPRFPMSEFRFKKYGKKEEKVRDKQYKSMYKKAQEFNTILQRELTKYESLSFWDHNGRFSFSMDPKNCRDKLGSDGIHMNNKGQYHLYKSLRGAIIHSCTNYSSSYKSYLLSVSGTCRIPKSFNTR